MTVTYIATSDSDGGTTGEVNTGSGEQTITYTFNVTTLATVANATYTIRAIAYPSIGTINQPASQWDFDVEVGGGLPGSIVVTAGECVKNQGGTFTITYIPETGNVVTETGQTIPSTFTAKKNTTFSITSIATPVNGNTYTGSATVEGNTPNENDFTQTVTLVYIDDTAPAITCPANITVECGASILPANTGTATATDNCTGSITISYTDNITLPGACGGTIIRTWKAKDVSNNENTCQQTIHVNPTAVASFVSVGDITVECGAATTSSLSYTNGKTGDCEISGSVTSSLSTIPGQCGGDITESWTYTDACNRTITASRIIHVNPTAVASFVSVGDITVECGTVPSPSTISFSNGLSGGCLISGTSNISTQTEAPINGCGTITEYWTATDACGRTVASVSRTIHVVDTTSPVLGVIDAPIVPVQIGTGFDLSATYTDCGTVTAKWWFTSNDVDFISIDGDVSTGSISLDATDTAFLETGVYKVKLVVKDACGNESKASHEYVVIYDPNGGFVTGGGWINSPVEAMTGTFQNVVGKANFGFNAKYKTGKNNTTEVDGNTNFQFQAGNLHFSSSTHDNMSLVISGAKATYTGEGTINGSGNYAFRLIAIDGDLLGSSADKFRIKIWTKGIPGDVIYDNQRGVSENSDDATVLGGGSIVIHKPKGKTSTTGKVSKLEDADLLPLEFNVSAYPNPSADYFMLKLQGMLNDDMQKVEVNVFDLLGRQVYSKQGNAQDSYEFGQNFQVGVYLVTVKQGNNVASLKVIKK